MPTYEFRCPDGHEFERFYRTISGAESQALCPECGKPAERRMSATGFAFKGSGFYLTDYGKNAHREKGAPAQDNGASSGSKGESAGDAKADVKSDAKSAKPDAASSGASSSAGESKPAKKAEPAPAAAPAKKSSSE